MAELLLQGIPITREKTDIKPSLVTYLNFFSSYIMCISGQRSLKSHHLGDKQALAFLLYEETGRFCHEPEKLFCCITLQTFGRQTSLSLSWGPDILNSQAKKEE